MLLLSTSSLKWYWMHKIFSFVKEAKYDGIDLVIDEKNYDSLDEKYLKSLSEEFGVPILSITAPDKWLSNQKIDKIIEMAKVFQTQVINFYPPHISDKNADFFVKYLSRIKKDLRISVSIQNVEQKFKLFVIPEYKNNNLLELKKITWDTALNIENIDKSSWIDLLKTLHTLWNTIVNVYLSDRDGTKEWLLPWNSGWWLSFLPIESFLMKLKSSGYSWFFSLKVKPTELWAGNEEKVLENLKDLKNYYKKNFVDYKV